MKAQPLNAFQLAARNDAVLYTATEAAKTCSSSIHILSYPSHRALSHTCQSSLFPLHFHSALPSPHLALSCMFMGFTQSFLGCFFSPAPPLVLSLIQYFPVLHSYLFFFTFLVFSLKSSQFQTRGISEIMSFLLCQFKPEPAKI